MGVGLGRHRPAVDQPPVTRTAPRRLLAHHAPSPAPHLPPCWGKAGLLQGWWISSLVIMEASPGATGSGGPSTLLARTKASVPPATAEHEDGHRDAPHAQSHAQDQKRWPSLFDAAGE